MIRDLFQRARKAATNHFAVKDLVESIHEADSVSTVAALVQRAAAQKLSPAQMKGVYSAAQSQAVHLMPDHHPAKQPYVDVVTASHKVGGEQRLESGRYLIGIVEANKDAVFGFLKDLRRQMKEWPSEAKDALRHGLDFRDRRFLAALEAPTDRDLKKIFHERDRFVAYVAEKLKTMSDLLRHKCAHDFAQSDPTIAAVIFPRLGKQAAGRTRMPANG